MRTKAANGIDQILDHPGAQYLNRAHERTFSLNIFRGNTFELQRRLAGYTHPDHHLELFYQKNAEKGRQAHREIIRLLHNFVCSAVTLVEHTRNMVKSNYLGSRINQQFTARVNRDFAENQLTRFVHELRNYFVHKGLPATKNELKLESNPSNGSDTFNAASSYYLDVAALSKWDSWTKPAREYLFECGQRIDLKELVRNYAATVEVFQKDLDLLLSVHHERDVLALKSLQEELGLYSIFEAGRTGGLEKFRQN